MDDTSKLLKTNIKCNTEPALEQLLLIITKLCWSKNIGIKVCYCLYIRIIFIIICVVVQLFRSFIHSFSS